MSNQFDPIIKLFLNYLKQFTNNSKYNLVLKGGSALKYLYNSPRFTNAIDLDAISGRSIDIIKNFCLKEKFSYFIKKDTETAERYTIQFDDNYHPLKIDISYRVKNLEQSQINVIDNIKVYTIDNLFRQKIVAYLGREQLRDLYDICFIYNSYKEYISDTNVDLAKSFLTLKGLEYADALIEIQKQRYPEINIDFLIDQFLTMYDDLGFFCQRAKPNA
jgi:predicted nucleotidyltransferase component of viral defense system